jgi:hypothetical protein
MALQLTAAPTPAAGTPDLGEGLRDLARQPILDLRGRVHGYELLFRNGPGLVFRGDGKAVLWAESAFRYSWFSPVDLKWSRQSVYPSIRHRVRCPFLRLLTVARVGNHRSLHERVDLCPEIPARLHPWPLRII